MAQIEIDENRDYDKALRALKQSVKQVRKVASPPSTRAAMFEQRLATVTRFAAARKLADCDLAQMLAICEDSEELIEAASAVRVGDVYALMMEYNHSVGNEAAAFSVMQRIPALQHGVQLR